MTAMTTNVVRAKTRFAAEAHRFASDSSGATAIEYALVAGVLSIAIAGAVSVLSGGVSDLYETIAAKVGG